VTESLRFHHYYVLASKGIQEYILRGDKLKLMIGGSELIDKLSSNLVERLLHAMGLSPESDFTILMKAAGGVRILFAEKEYAERFAALLPPAISRYAPGLDFVQTVREVGGSLAEAMDEAEKTLAVRRNLVHPSYPVPGPLVERSPRSGLPSCGILKFSGGSREEADESMIAKHGASESAKSELARRTLPEDRFVHGVAELPLPDDLADLADGENSTIAIVHIDANGLGQIVTSLFEELKADPDGIAREKYVKFCTAIQNATELSAKEALKPIIEDAEKNDAPRQGKRCYPFRPLVCAGDDFTIVLRAKDAVEFTRRYLDKFEEYSREEFGKTGVAKLADRDLTACGGIVFVKKSFPFSQAYGLCESLCAFAKDRTKRECSALAFWRLTASKIEDFDSILTRELTIELTQTNEKTVLTMMPYAAGGKNTVHPSVEALLKLRDAVKGMPRGGLRSLLTELYSGKEAALQSFERICDVAKGRTDTTSINLKRLMEALETITRNSGRNALFREHATPLHDAVELLSAERS